MRIQKHSNYKPKFRKEYEIEVCYKCNWDCEYCCVETHTKQPKTDKEIFDKAEEVRDKRAKDLGRVVELAAFTSPPPKERFKMKKADNKMPVDPFERVEYSYSLIESEE